MLEWIVLSCGDYYAHTGKTCAVLDRRDTALLDGEYTISDLEQIIAKMREVQGEEFKWQSKIKQALAIIDEVVAHGVPTGHSRAVLKDASAILDRVLAEAEEVQDSA